jgi:sarcosine oxidase
METLQARCVVIGAGAMGSATAYHLARRGVEVTLIEQFALGHSRGSSHGAARITRHSYADALYARLMPLAFRAWKELEADAGESLYIRTGGVSFSPSGVDYADCVAANLTELGIPHWAGSGRSWNKVHPTFALPDTYGVVFEPDAGMVAAERALAVQVDMARRHGGDRARILEATPVKRIDLDSDHPIVVTDSARIVAEKVIVTAGAWVKRLLPGLAVPLQVTRQHVLYLNPGNKLSFSIGRFPVFIFKGASADAAFYGMPDFQGLGVKVARHGGPEVNPDLGDSGVSDEYRSIVRSFLSAHIPALADASIGLTETCLYTVAPADRFILDFLPGRADVIVASPCSGHGFKFSCLIGKILADLATEARTAIDISGWSLS